ncbi:hypothetical protein FQN57_001283 [Myotisia sp. PD_48]|nr:hypothetical protein FQN57_001283 [Myotisia sp. PD_48]
MAVRDKEVLPPPTNIIRTGQKKPAPPLPPSWKSRPTKTVSIPLPLRPTSHSNTPLPPALPPRKSPAQSVRAPSEASLSTGSLSPTSTGSLQSRSSVDVSPRPEKYQLRAPAWNERDLPPVVTPRNNLHITTNTNTTSHRNDVSPSVPKDFRPYNGRTADETPNRENQGPPRCVADLRRALTSDDRFEPSLPVGKPLLPLRADTTIPEVPQSSPPYRPPLPSRPSAPSIVENTQMTQSSTTPRRKLPPLPPKRDALQNIGASSISGSKKSAWGTSPTAVANFQPIQQLQLQVKPRNLAPTHSNDALQNIRESSFATLKTNVQDNKSAIAKSCTCVHEQQQRQQQSLEPVRTSPPPPVPLASRPNIRPANPQSISLLQHSVTTPAEVCLKCRDFSAPDTHATKFPLQSLRSHDIAWLSGQLTRPFPSPTDKARALFTWLHHNISYDVDSFFNKRIPPQEPGLVLATGLGVCSGYAALFKELATHAGLEVKLISGHGMGYGLVPTSPSDPVPVFSSNHAWNAVRIDKDEWKLIDACWGAGNVQGPGKPYNKHFSPECFTMSNNDFGMRHYPTNTQHDLHRDDSRVDITWESYIRGSLPGSGPSDPPTVFTNARQEHGIEERSIQPACKSISIHQVAGRPVRFQFGHMCPHWSITKHGGKRAASLFALLSHGIDGREPKYLPFDHVRGTSPGGGGDSWYLDIPDGRVLGCAGLELMVYAITMFGDRADARGLTAAEFNRDIGRVAMGCSGVALWQLV